MSIRQLDIMDYLSTQIIIYGDCLEKMKEMADNSIDCIVTDPPYGISFMGKGWDCSTPGIEFWREAKRISKPGSSLLAFGGTRTCHKITSSIEEAGWEIRDLLMWIYGSGFPKSHNFGRKLCDSWSGYGTALKPAYEPIIMAMKPLDGTFAHNAEKWGVAGINIDASRIPTNGEFPKGSGNRANQSIYNQGWKGNNGCETPSKGRWPANIILDEIAAVQLDQQTRILKSGSGIKNPVGGSIKGFQSSNWKDSGYREGDSGGASRFFYCAKASSSERQGSTHPTMKPIKLMEYLITLIRPPNSEAVLLDPFLGSGTTLLACKNLGMNAIGIEKELEYIEIAKKRLK